MLSNTAASISLTKVLCFLGPLFWDTTLSNWEIASRFVEPEIFAVIGSYVALMVSHRRFEATIFKGQTMQE
jgi:hypothetical protein